MTREKVAAFVWLMLASLIIGMSVGLSARANADETEVPFIGDGAAPPSQTWESPPGIGSAAGRGLLP